MDILEGALLMKVKRIIVPSIVLIATIILCSFTIIPTIILQSDNGDTVNLSYLDAIVDADNNTLTLYANYNNYGNSFEIGQDLVVSTDHDFNTVLKMTSCVLEKDRYVYTFAIDNPVSKIFISPPVLYVPADISATETKLSSSNAKVTLGSEEWFTISSVETSEIEKGLFAVKVSIIPKNDILPRLPKLVIDGKKYGASSSLSFNEEKTFISGEFCFFVPTESAENLSAMLESATLVVENALNKVYAKDSIFSTNIESLDIVVE